MTYSIIEGEWTRVEVLGVDIDGFALVEARNGETYCVPIDALIEG